MDRFTVDRNSSLHSAIAEWKQISRRQAKAIVDERRVLVNRERVWSSRHPVYRNDTVTLTPPYDPPDTLETLFESEDCRVSNKPAGVLSNEADDSLEALLQEQHPEYPALRAAHRLDRETSGCLVFSHHRSAHSALIKAFKRGEVNKQYLAIVVATRGLHRLRDRIRVKQPINHRTALTEGRVLHRAGNFALLQLRIPTGRTHQIRIHMNHLDCPILGDKQYAVDRKLTPLEIDIPRHMLHAWKLDFPDPADPQYHISTKAPPPNDFLAALQACALRLPPSLS